MQVLADSGTGAVSKIHPHIEAFRMIEVAQRTNSPLAQIHHFGRLCGTQIIEFGRMRVRSNQEVP